ncbi:hypothetical protein F5148DRAFT_1150783 [Russula earlei]|uniref:Uncharacterized protein n=1 Tax=Russula earlei TaxID=71964 RepID=A0ACC0U4D7_9AGAM|nr:hypothetical protein F5148DRAFT_1150783 [Russula earlei]
MVLGTCGGRTGSTLSSLQVQHEDGVSTVHPSSTMVFGDCYIAPVTRDDVFFYDKSHGLHVRPPKDDRSFPRADPKHLHYLLTWTDPGPVLTKKGVPRKRQPHPHRDETGAYYTAQMMHYGLKPLKTKQAAKRALLAMFRDGHNLEVPDRLQKLEEDLRDLWHVENEKGRVRYEQEKAEREREKGDRQRKQREHLAEMRRRHEAILADAGEVEDVALRATSSRKRKATGAGDAGSAKKKAKASGSNEKLSPLEVQGKFVINAPYLAEQWPDNCAEGDLVLTLSPSRRTGKHLWGSFNFGVVIGVIRCGAPPTSVRRTVAFQWRGHEQGEGQMVYGPYNKGTLTFLGDGKVRGTMEGNPCSRFTFTGVQKPLKNIVWVKNVKQWKQRWRGINDRSYEAASRARWGGWHRDGEYEEPPAGSDTTSAEDVGDDDEGTVDYA